MLTLLILNLVAFSGHVTCVKDREAPGWRFNKELARCTARASGFMFLSAFALSIFATLFFIPMVYFSWTLWREDRWFARILHDLESQGYNLRFIEEIAIHPNGELIVMSSKPPERLNPTQRD